MWILLPNIDLRCFVARQFLLRIYALLSVKFSGLKMCECKKMTNIRYGPWIDLRRPPMTFKDKKDKKYKKRQQMMVWRHCGERWILKKSCFEKEGFSLLLGLKSFGWYDTWVIFWRPNICRKLRTQDKSHQVKNWTIRFSASGNGDQPMYNWPTVTSEQVTGFFVRFSWTAV